MYARGIVAVCALVIVTSVAGAQTGVRRVRRHAFGFAVTPYVALGSRGVRANQADAATCPATPDECFKHKASSGPEVGAQVQIPLFGTFGLSVAGSFARPRQLVCILENCSSRDRVTTVRGTALLLWRFKARAPIYFGLGGATVRWGNPGPVVGQNQAVSEYGFVISIGYDAAIGRRAGVRVAFLNYFMFPEESGLPSTFAATGTARDAILTIGARINIGS